MFDNTIVPFSIGFRDPSYKQLSSPSWWQLWVKILQQKGHSNQVSKLNYSFSRLRTRVSLFQWFIFRCFNFWFALQMSANIFLNTSASGNNRSKTQVPRRMPSYKIRTVKRSHEKLRKGILRKSRSRRISKKRVSFHKFVKAKSVKGRISWIKINSSFYDS